MTTTTLGMQDPSTVATMSVDALLQQVWRNKAYLESVKPDPLFNNKDLIKPIVVGDRQMVPNVNSFFINVTPENKGARNINLAFIKALNMNPVEGNAKFLGNEGSFDMKWTKVFANDWAGGITLQNFGIDARELKNYNLNQESTRLLYQWRTEILGYYAREAIVQTRSHNLTANPLGLTQSYNKNWYVPSIADANQPAYHATDANFADNIGTAVASAGTNATFTITRMLQMLNYFQDSWLEPVTLESGKEMYLMTVSPKQMLRLKDPSITGSWAHYWQNVSAVKEIERIIPTGKFILDDKLVLVEDRRSPTMVVTGGGSLNTLAFGYEKAGRTTTRNTNLYTSGTTYYTDLNLVMGKGSLMWYEPEKTHKEKQPDEYSQFEGNALFQAIGYSTPVWNVDADNADATTAQQESSFVVPTIRT